jgi:hypothetical protein
MAPCGDRAARGVTGRGGHLLLGAGFGHKHGPGGLYERIFLGLELLWIALTAGYLAAGRPQLNRPG